MHAQKRILTPQSARALQFDAYTKQLALRTGAPFQALLRHCKNRQFKSILYSGQNVPELLAIAKKFPKAKITAQGMPEDVFRLIFTAEEIAPAIKLIRKYGPATAFHIESLRAEAAKLKKRVSLSHCAFADVPETERMDLLFIDLPQVFGTAVGDFAAKCSALLKKMGMLAISLNTAHIDAVEDEHLSTGFVQAFLEALAKQVGAKMKNRPKMPDTISTSEFGRHFKSNRFSPSKNPYSIAQIAIGTAQFLDYYARELAEWLGFFPENMAERARKNAIAEALIAARESMPNGMPPDLSTRWIYSFIFRKK